MIYQPKKPKKQTNPPNRCTGVQPPKPKVHLVQAECANCRFSAPKDCSAPIISPCRSALADAADFLEREAEKYKIIKDGSDIEVVRLVMIEKYNKVKTAAEACRIVFKLLEKGKTDFDLLKFIEENKDA